MKQKTPHKHAELIKKWADDTSIKFQFKSKCDNEWNDLDYIYWLTDYEYRIKPEVIRYRVALLNDGPGYYVVSAYRETDANNFEKMGHFIKWLTNWIEVEI